MAKWKVNLLTVLFGLTAMIIFYFVTGGSFPDLFTRQDAGIDPEINPSVIKDIKEKDEDEKLISGFLNMNRISIYKNGLVTPESLVNVCRDGAKTNECNAEIAKITEIIKTSGIIKTAYLYAKVGVSRDNEPLGQLTQYDSFWFYMTNDFEKEVVDSVTYGGHLLRSKALVNRVADDGTNELLFDLSKLPVTNLPYSDDNSSKNVDVLDVLNRPGRHFTGGFVSTLGLGKISDLQIGYEGGLIENYKGIE